MGRMETCLLEGRNLHLRDLRRLHPLGANVFRETFWQRLVLNTLPAALRFASSLAGQSLASWDLGLRDLHRDGLGRVNPEEGLDLRFPVWMCLRDLHRDGPGRDNPDEG